jgi:hypothetical protein
VVRIPINVILLVQSAQLLKISIIRLALAVQLFDQLLENSHDA